MNHLTLVADLLCQTSVFKTSTMVEPQNYYNQEPLLHNFHLEFLRWPCPLASALNTQITFKRVGSLQLAPSAKFNHDRCLGPQIKRRLVVFVSKNLERAKKMMACKEKRSLVQDCCPKKEEKLRRQVFYKILSRAKLIFLYLFLIKKYRWSQWYL